MGQYTALNKKTTGTCIDMDESQKPDAEHEKPDTEIGTIAIQ